MKDLLGRADWVCLTSFVKKLQSTQVSREEEQPQCSALLLRQAAIPAWCTGKTAGCIRPAKLKPDGSRLAGG